MRIQGSFTGLFWHAYLHKLAELGGARVLLLDFVRGGVCVCVRWSCRVLFDDLVHREQVSSRAKISMKKKRE